MTDDQDDALAMQVRFSTEGFLTREQAENSGAWKNEDYIYVFKLRPFAWRGMSAREIKAGFGTDSPSELLTKLKLRSLFSRRP